MIKGPPEFSKKSWRPPWIFSAASHLYLWSEKSPPENTKAMESAPLNLWRHFLSPPENEKAILMPPWILRRKTERRIHSKTAIFNRSIQGGLAHQKCYARVQPGHSVRRGNEPFFYSGVNYSWLGMAQKWSILDQKWPNMAGLSTLQSGPKGTKMVKLSVFDHLGPLLGPFGPFGTILDKDDLLP